MPENLAALFLGQIDVEDNEIGTRRPIIAVSLVEKSHGLFPIVHDVKLGVNMGGLDRLADEIPVRRVIFDDQDMARLRDRFFRPGG